MPVTRRRPAIILFILLGIALVGLTVALNVGWIIMNWREQVMLFLGIPIFIVVIAGVVVNTIFLVREIRRNERQDSFLNSVTHELKTPIASIRLYLETLQRHNVPEEKRREFYEIMLADSDRLLSTVEQVLKAGEISQRLSRQVREQLDLTALTRASIATTLTQHHLAPEAIVFEVAGEIPGKTPGTPPQPANGAEVSIEPPVAMPGESSDQAGIMVLGNPEELHTALLNLLSNAVKYSPEGVKATVRLSLRGEKWAMLEISDRGIGIDPLHLKRIFKRFYRVPSRAVMRAKGTGLGLFLVRSIARQHGGDAFAESEGEGRGSTFTLKLPRIKGEKSASLLPTPYETNTVGAPRKER